MQNSVTSTPDQASNRRGFTIVELLIVIVVIGILVAITIVAYNGVQARARDTKRLSDIAAIQQALELYHVDHGVYPPTDLTTGGNGYSLSWATDGTWMKTLVDGGYLKQVPVDPINDTTQHFYSYMYVPKNNYGCTEPSNFYILWARETDGTTSPPGSASFVCPSAGWNASPTYWVFKKND